MAWYVWGGIGVGIWMLVAVFIVALFHAVAHREPDWTGDPEETEGQR